MQPGGVSLAEQRTHEKQGGGAVGPTRRRSCSPRSGAWWTQGGGQGGREPRHLSLSLLQRPGGEMGSRSRPGAVLGGGGVGWEAGNTPAREEIHSTVAWTGPSFDKGSLRLEGVWPLSQGHTVAGGRAKPRSRTLTAGHRRSPRRLHLPGVWSALPVLRPPLLEVHAAFLGTSFILHNLLTIPLQPASALHS